MGLQPALAAYGEAIGSLAILDASARWTSQQLEERLPAAFQASPEGETGARGGHGGGQEERARTRTHERNRRPRMMWSTSPQSRHNAYSLVKWESPSEPEVGFATAFKVSDRPQEFGRQAAADSCAELDRPRHRVGAAASSHVEGPEDGNQEDG